MKKEMDLYKVNEFAKNMKLPLMIDKAFEYITRQSHCCFKPFAWYRSSNGERMAFMLVEDQRGLTKILANALLDVEDNIVCCKK